MTFLYLNEIKFEASDVLNVAHVALYLQFDELKTLALDYLEKNYAKLTFDELADNIYALISTSATLLPPNSKILDTLWKSMHSDINMLKTRPYPFVEAYVRLYGKDMPFNCCSLLKEWSTCREKEFAEHSETLLTMVDFYQLDPLSLVSVAEMKILPIEPILELLKVSLKKQSEVASAPITIKFEAEVVKEFVLNGMLCKFGWLRERFRIDFPTAMESQVIVTLSTNSYSPIKKWCVTPYKRKNISINFKEARGSGKTCNVTAQ